MTDPDFEALRPFAQRIADTQRALRDPIPKNLDRELDNHRDKPIRWDDDESREANAWAQACTLYITPRFLIDAGWSLTMTWPEHVHRIIDATHTNPDYRTQVLEGLRLRAALDPKTGLPALGKAVKHAGCTGSFQPATQRCDECGTHYVLRRVRERCTVCDAFLEQNQWELGLCRTHRLKLDRNRKNETCQGHARHLPIGAEGDTLARCNRCKKEVEFVEGSWTIHRTDV